LIKINVFHIHSTKYFLNVIITHTEEILVGKLQREILSHRREDNIKTNLLWVVCKGVDRNEMNKARVNVNSVINFWEPQKMEVSWQDFYKHLEKSLYQ
jgi:hypothetical protein